MRANWMVALGAAVTLCGCVTGTEMGTNWAPMTLTPDQVAAIQDGVKKALKDPGSAQFGELKASISDKNLVAVCGMVNAKNGFGGYTGMQPFVGVFNQNPPAFQAAAFGGTESATWATMTQCRIYGISL